MTTDPMRELQNRGWEFGSEMKTHSHTTNLSEEEVREEVVYSKRWLVENGFAEHVPMITSPYGNYDETVLDTTAGYYAMGRIVNDTLNWATLTNPLHISGHSVYSDNISRTKELIDLAVKYNQTAVLNFHGLNEYAWQLDGKVSSERHSSISPTKDQMPFRSSRIRTGGPIWTNYIAISLITLNCSQTGFTREVNKYSDS